MNEKIIKETRSLLKKYEADEVDSYIKYLSFLANQKDKKTQQLKNPWMQKRSAAYFADCFKAVKKDALVFDGKHITLQFTGISYDYIAYKNKMLNVYPESLIDVQLVRMDDKFKFSKDSGRVIYQHEMTNPFNDSQVLGAYCVIKNKRGEFLTVLSEADIQKHRKVAKTGDIWERWPDEMRLKTVIKKACKTHFADVYQNIETLDNEQYDLEQPLGISVETKEEIEKINSPKELIDYFNQHKDENAGVLEDFTKACTARKEAIIEAQKQAEAENEDS